MKKRERCCFFDNLFTFKLQRCELIRTILFAIFSVLVLAVLASAQGDFVIGTYSINGPRYTDYQGIDSIGCEYLYLFAWDDYLDDAFSLSGNLKLFLGRPNMYGPSSGRQLKYEAEGEPNLSYPSWFRNHDVGVIGSDNISWSARKGIHPEGYLAANLNPKDAPYSKRRKPFNADYNYVYRYTVCLRIDTTGTETATTPVVDVELWWMNSPQKDFLVYTHEIQRQDFPHANAGYDTIYFSFDLAPYFPSPDGDSIDIRVYWHGEITAYLDHVMVRDNIGHMLFHGQLDSLIDSEATGLESRPGSERLYRHYLRDEPYPVEMAGYNYVNGKL